MFSETLGARIVLKDVLIGSELNNFAIWLVVVFYNISHLLQSEVPLMRGNICEYKNKWLDFS